jgi:AcrR family transcriptional regulator
MDDAKPSRQRRFPADQRRAEMLRKAADHFASHGFDSSTRAVAAALGVTQALIYKHFKSKDDLIEQVLEAALGAPRQRPSLNLDLSSQQSLSLFYKAFVASATETRMRLFIRAGLDGRSWPSRRGNALTRDLFLPAIAMLRASAGLPGLDQTLAMRGERELVMMLHASMVFLGIRRHVYGMPMPENLDDVVDLYVRTFFEGAVPAMRKLHDEGEESLTVTLLGQPSDQNPDSATLPDRIQTSSK